MEMEYSNIFINSPVGLLVFDRIKNLVIGGDGDNRRVAFDWTCAHGTVHHKVFFGCTYLIDTTVSHEHPDVPAPSAPVAPKERVN